MRHFLKKLHFYLFLFFSGFWYFVLWLPLNYFAQKPSRYGGMIRVRRIWALLGSWCVGIRYKFIYEQPIDWARAYVVCPLHTSNLDTSMVCLLFKHTNYTIIGKHTLLDGLLTGIFFRTVDIPINRDSKISAFRAFKAAAKSVEVGKSLVMFPEGGIANVYPPHIQQFKTGPFRLAIELQVPVLPVTSLNTWQMLWDNGVKHGSKPGLCKIFVHEPVETKGLTVADADRLRDQIHGLISNKFDAANNTDQLMAT